MEPSLPSSGSPEGPGQGLKACKPARGTTARLDVNVSQRRVRTACLTLKGQGLSLARCWHALPFRCQCTMCHWSDELTTGGMQHDIDSADMKYHDTPQGTSDGAANLCVLPHDILKSIIRGLSFRDKCSLELISRGFHALLSHPSSADGLWGPCNSISDLTLDDRFCRNVDIMRLVPAPAKCSLIRI